MEVNHLVRLSIAHGSRVSFCICSGQASDPRAGNGAGTNAANKTAQQPYSDQGTGLRCGSLPSTAAYQLRYYKHHKALKIGDGGRLGAVREKP